MIRTLGTCQCALAAIGLAGLSIGAQAPVDHRRIEVSRFPPARRRGLYRP